MPCAAADGKVGLPWAGEARTSRAVLCCAVPCASCPLPLIMGAGTLAGTVVAVAFYEDEDEDGRSTADAAGRGGGGGNVRAELQAAWEKGARGQARKS